MKKKSILHWFLFAFGLISIISLFSGCERTITKNDFNGGFEAKSKLGNEPAGWYATRVPETKDFVVFAWDSTEQHTGKYSVSIAIDSIHPQNVIAYNWTRTFDDFIVGKKYSISGWIKAKNLNETAWLVVQCWDDNQKLIGLASTQSSSPVKGTTDWAQVKSEITIPNDTKEVRVRVGIASPRNNGGKVWFDDIKIE